MLVALCAASLVARAAIVLRTDILPDEAIYWWASVRQLAFSPHPPLVSLLIRLGELILGHSVPGMRLMALVLGTALIAMAYALGRALFGRRAGLWAAGLTAATPVAVAAGILATPDAPLLCLWLGFIYCAWRGTRGGGWWWVAAGVTLGLGLHAKYMMVLAVPALALVLVGTPSGRAALRRPGPWLAGGIAALVFAPPFLVWNARHGWSSLRFHLSSRHEWLLVPEHWGEYLFGHAGLISPLLWVACLGALVAAVGRWRRGRQNWAWVAAFGLVPILFFLPFSLFTDRQMLREHWDAIGYAVAIVGVGGLVTERQDSRPRWAWPTASSAAVLTLCVLAAALWPTLAVRLGARPPTTKMMGWRALAESTRRRLDAVGTPGAFVIGDSWRTTLCVGFYMRDEAHLYALPHERNRDYGVGRLLGAWDMGWRALRREEPGSDALYVHEHHRSSHTGREDLPVLIHRMFDDVRPVEDLYIRCDGREIAHFGLFEAHGLRPKLRSMDWVRRNVPGVAHWLRND